MNVEVLINKDCVIVQVADPNPSLPVMCYTNPCMDSAGKDVAYLMNGQIPPIWEDLRKKGCPPGKLFEQMPTSTWLRLTLDDLRRCVASPLTSMTTSKNEALFISCLRKHIFT